MSLYPTPYRSAVPPLIPGSASLQTLQVDTAKIESIVGGALSKLSTWKGSVTAATTANIATSGLGTIDGVTLVAGDSILVKNQTTGSENGLYTVSTGVWTRSPDLVDGSNAAGIAGRTFEESEGVSRYWNDSASGL